MLLHVRLTIAFHSSLQSSTMTYYTWTVPSLRCRRFPTESRTCRYNLRYAKSTLHLGKLSERVLEIETEKFWFFSHNLSPVKEVACKLKMIAC